MKKEALRMDRVTCIRRGIRLLDNFNFQIFAGEVMGLVSLDSHGLDTLLSLLGENLPLYFGYVYIGEQLVNSYAIHIRSDNRVAVISHEDNLVPYLSVAENIFVLRRGGRRTIRRRQIEGQLRLHLDELGLSIPASRPISEMTRFELYVAEILKAVIARAELIVLCDPLSVLGNADMRRLHGIIRHYAAKGQAFLYIGTRGGDLTQICDRVSVMENGRIVKVCRVGDGEEAVLRRYLAPAKQTAPLPAVLRAQQGGPPAFACRGLTDGTLPPLSFEVQKGEFLLISSDDRTAGDCLTRALQLDRGVTGSLRIGGRRPGKRSCRKIALILENPADSMIFKDMSCEDNLCLTLGRRMPEIWRSAKTRRSIAREVMGEELPEPGIPVGQLTMLQKYRLVYTRIRLQKPDVVFCIHPYLNVDIGIRNYIFSELRAFREAGTAVVVVSVSPDNVRELAHRVINIKKYPPFIE